MSRPFKLKKKISKLSQAAFIPFLAGSSLLCTPNAYSASGTWSRGFDDTDALWSLSTNWTSGIIADGAGSTAFFSNLNLINGTRNVILDSTRTIGSMYIGDNNVADRQAYTFSSINDSVLRFDGGEGPARLVQQNNAAMTTIDVPLVLDSDLEIYNLASAYSLELKGNISGSKFALQTLTIGGYAPPGVGTSYFPSTPATGKVIFDGEISNGVGLMRLVIDSSTGSTVSLNQANTYSGGTVLNNGTLELNHLSSLGRGALTINGGSIGALGTVRLTYTSGTNLELHANFNANNAAVIDIGNGGTTTLYKNINISTTNQQFGLYGKIVDGPITTPPTQDEYGWEYNEPSTPVGYSLTKSGQGILFLNNSTNSFSGGVIVESGRMVIGNLASIGTGNLTIRNGGGAGYNTHVVDQNYLNRLTQDSMGIFGIWGTRDVVNHLDFSYHENVFFGAASGTLNYSGKLRGFNDVIKLAAGASSLSRFTSAIEGEGVKVIIGFKGTSGGAVTFAAHNTYTGDTLLQGNIPFRLEGATGSISQESTIRMRGNGTFSYEYTGATEAINTHLGALVFELGDAQVQHNLTLDYDGALNFTSIDRVAGATANFTSTGTARTFNAANNKTTFASGVGSNSFMGAGYFFNGTHYAGYDANGYVRALNYATDLNTAVISAASNTALANAAGKHVNVTTALSSQSTASVASLRFQGAQNITLGTSAILTVAEGGILKADAGTANLSGGAGITAGDKELVIRANASTDTLHISSNILSSSTKGLTKSGAGLLILSGTNTYGGNTTVNTGILRILGAQALGAGDVHLNGGNLDLRANGTAKDSAKFEDIYFGQNLVINGDSTITVGNIAGSANIQNKTIVMGNLAISGNDLTVTNNQGFGLKIGGTTTLSQGDKGNTTFSTTNVRPSSFIPTLTFEGKVTGRSRLTFRGNGTTRFTNAQNDFVGDLWITAGVVEASSDGTLGSLANQVVLNDATTATTSTFRAIDSFSTYRTIVLGNGLSNKNLLQVTSGHTLSLLSAFGGDSGFVKGDRGTLALWADNTNWHGDIFVNAGILSVHSDDALGTQEGFTQVGNHESAVHLGGITTAENFLIQGSGISGTGALYATSGNNLLTGQIELAADTTIGVAEGAFLELGITSPITLRPETTALTSFASNYDLTLTGGGEGVVQGKIDIGTQLLTKSGSGTWTLNHEVQSHGAVQILEGTLVLAGEQTALSNNSHVRISSAGNLVLDNSSYALDYRLGKRGTHLAGNLTIIGHQSQDVHELIQNSNLMSSHTQSVVTLETRGQGSIRFDIASSGNTYNRNGRATTLYRGTGLGLGGGPGTASMFTVDAPPFLGQTNSQGGMYQGILSWALVDSNVAGTGDSFATYDRVYGLRALRAEETTHQVIADANLRSGYHIGLTHNASINSIQLNDQAGISNLDQTQLTIQSGGILAKEGNTGIHGGVITSTREMVVHTQGGLEISSVIDLSTGGLTKSGEGTLTLSGQNRYLGGTHLNQGTLKLAGGDQTLRVNQALTLNYGATLDLNGNHQSVGQFQALGSSGGEVPLLGGTLTNTSVDRATFAFSQATTLNTYFGGTITGNLNLVRSHGNNFDIYNELSYTGKTLLNGGITSLKNGGNISQTEKIHLQYGTLQLHNNLDANHFDRIADHIEIEMNGSTLAMYGRYGTMSSETIGKVTVSGGMNVISSSTGGNNALIMPFGSTLNIIEFSRDAQSGSTVNFAQNYTSGSSERLGLISSTGGASENILLGNVSTVNHLLGPWAVITNYYSYQAMELVGYDSQAGVGALNITGQKGYDYTVVPATSQANANLRLTGNGVLNSGGMALNGINMVADANNLAPTLQFQNANDLLNLTAGIIAFSQQTSAASVSVNHFLGHALNQGRITAGGAQASGPVDLFVYHQNSIATNNLTINAAVVNNGSNALRLIINATNFGHSPVVLASTQNAYTGGTVVNNNTLRFSGNLGTGGVTLHGSNLVQLDGGTFQAQDFTLNGPSGVNLVGTNTINNLAINNLGGSKPSASAAPSNNTLYASPSVTLGTGGILNLGGGVTVTSQDISTTAVITGGTLQLNGATRTFNVGTPIFAGGKLSPEHVVLNVSSVIAGAGYGVIKQGEGIMQMGGNNTFNGGVQVVAGGLMVSHNNAFGTGSLTLGHNTVLTADATARSISNQLVLNGDLTLGVNGAVLANKLTMSGTANLGAGHRIITVNAAKDSTQTFSGILSGSGGITKKGVGTLALTNFNAVGLNWSGSKAIRVEGGSLEIAIDQSLGSAPTQIIEDNIVLSGGSLTVSTNLVLHQNRGIAIGSDPGSSSSGILHTKGSSTVLTYGGVIRDGAGHVGNLQKHGAGNLYLSGANTYTGATTLAEGSITLAQSGSIAHSHTLRIAKDTFFDVTAHHGGFHLNSGQTLEGLGGVMGTVVANQGSKVAPGLASSQNTGSLYISGDLILNSGSTLTFDLRSPTFISTNNFGGNEYFSQGFYDYVLANLPSGGTTGNHDQLILHGSLIQEEGAMIQILASGFTPQYGEVYDLGDWSQVSYMGGESSAAYAGLNGESSYAITLPDIGMLGLSWDLSQFGSHGLIMVIPEPSRALLMILALGSLLMRRRR